MRFLVALRDVVVELTVRNSRSESGEGVRRTEKGRIDKGVDHVRSRQCASIHHCRVVFESAIPHGRCLTIEYDGAALQRGIIRENTIIDIQTRVVIRDGAFTDNRPAKNRTAIPVELGVRNARGMRSRFERVQYFESTSPL